MSEPDVNRLQKEKSPYLQQHAHNPVDWYPWGKEAFARAKGEDRPVFLSIGYSTCHWCHVMRAESFEDTEVAQLLNEDFISIKVDREERPDIDSYYMTTCQMLTGTGGWPLTIIMSPDRQPFFAATYLPKSTRFGRQGLLQILPQVAEAWRKRRVQILDSAQKISELTEKATQFEGKGKVSEEILHTAYRQLAAAYDEKAGGFGQTPKFPTPHNLSFLLRYWSRTGQDKALQMVEHTLKRMRNGGIYDHIGYGFHRYSTDALWHVPHFEKMLYDQALLIIVYTEAFQMTNDPFYERTVRESIEYVLRDMRSELGGFYSAEDADSDGQEGMFYTWTEGEIRKILRTAEAEAVIKVFNIASQGNYEDEGTRSKSGRNILHITGSLKELASELAITQRELETRITLARNKMFEYRGQRVPPHKDKKILCDWNGLMIAALARASRTMDDGTYKHAALEAADFILTRMQGPEGILYHRFIDGDTAIPAFLDDYGFLIWGLIELYEATLEPKFLVKATELNGNTVDLFWDRANNAFFATRQKSELPLRKKEIYDGAMPSGNAIMMFNMLRLSRLTGDYDLEERANGIAHYFAGQIQKNPLSHMQTMIALSFAFSPSIEVVISGAIDDGLTTEMLRTINRLPMLDVPIVFRASGPASEIFRIAPFTADLLPVAGKTTAYVCQDYRCELPINELQKLRKMLGELADARNG